MEAARNLNPARRYIDREMAKESKDPAVLRHLSLCYMDAYEQALAILAHPARRSFDWRKDVIP